MINTMGKKMKAEVGKECWVWGALNIRLSKYECSFAFLFLLVVSPFWGKECVHIMPIVTVIFVSITGIGPSVCQVCHCVTSPCYSVRVSGEVVRAPGMDTSRSGQRQAGSCGFACNTHGLPAGVSESTRLSNSPGEGLGNKNSFHFPTTAKHSISM